jgi:pimeloyl-ACP methyl ester carboxylesterase
MPMLVYFGGYTDEDPMEQAAREVRECAEKFGNVAEESFILIQPLRPHKQWWVFEMTTERDSSGTAWVDGAYSDNMAAALAELLTYLVDHDNVDKSRVALAGFSAGAYACTELLPQRLPKLCAVVVGGLHGHATPDPAADKIIAKKWLEAEASFAAYLSRAALCPGMQCFEATHCTDDKMCSWANAEKILDRLDAAQRSAGEKPIIRRFVDSPAVRGNRAQHDYWGATFVRPELFRTLFACGQSDAPMSGLSAQMAEDYAILPNGGKQMRMHECADKWQTAANK